MNKPDFIFLHDTIMALEQAETHSAQLRDYCGLRDQVERLTDLLICSLFPRTRPSGSPGRRVCCRLWNCCGLCCPPYWIRSAPRRESSTP